MHEYLYQCVHVRARAEGRDHAIGLLRAWIVKVVEFELMNCTPALLEACRCQTRLVQPSAIFLAAKPLQILCSYLVRTFNIKLYGSDWGPSYPVRRR